VYLLGVGRHGLEGYGREEGHIESAVDEALVLAENMVPV